jgi:MFS family permease
MITIFRGAKGRVFILICLMFFISYVDRVNISIAAPIMRKELHLTNTQLGFVLSAFGLCYATFQMTNGFLGDYLGPRRMLSALGLVWSAGTLLTAASTGLASLVIGRAVVGLGEGGTIPTAARARSNWVSPGIGDSRQDLPTPARGWLPSARRRSCWASFPFLDGAVHSRYSAPLD